EGQQDLLQVSNQIADLQEQLAILLDLPTCTQFELVEPPLPPAPVKCADEAVALALADNPDIREADQNIEKAPAAVRAAKLDYVHSIALAGGLTNQTAADYIQANTGFIGVVRTFSFVDRGTRKNAIPEGDAMVAKAALKPHPADAPE